MWWLRAYFNNPRKRLVMQRFGGYNTTQIELCTTGKKYQVETTEINTSGDINVGNQLTDIILQIKFCSHHAKDLIVNPICCEL